jgi:hypothetical protein
MGQRELKIDHISFINDKNVDFSVSIKNGTFKCDHSDNLDNSSIKIK